MVKRLLLLNRKIVRFTTPYMYALGTALAVIMGASIISGHMPNNDLSHIPKWQGYIWMWLGMVLLISYGVDLIFRIISPLVGLRKKETLSQRIARVENPK